MKKLVTVLVVLLLATSLFAQGGSESKSSAGAVLNFKLAENQPANNPISKGMLMFADLVKEKTNGTVLIDVYLDAQLGNENETIDQVQIGALDFARINTSALASTADEVGVFTLPYIFTSTDHKYKVLDGAIGQGVSDSLKKYNIIGLEYWEAGSRNFYSTKKPIKSVADIKGMKVRVQQSEVAIKMVELLGGAATPMSYGEVYQGLQTGVIDAAENDFVSYYTSGHYEVAKYYSLDAHMAPPAMLLMSQNSWNKLNDSQKQAVREAAKEAALWQRQAMMDFQNESRAKVEEAGCQIFEVDGKAFQKAVSPIYDLYPQYKSIIEQIKAVN
ncbi:MAG: TRAP transporter substrate-binding protein [Sphaerochaeta sp.]|jgi:tripartite ATP-independent transporter DctP family solute receptor|nr:TRAP transporter substrate-binding protein [Sphaerochaeta sp.]HBO36465.1 C4-dicarboxylate ABC transporter [Sphaerochaeta sp.]